MLEAGWKEVRVVTDHGWLLLAGGPAEVGLAEVPDGDPLAAVRRREAESATVDLACFPWFWADDVRIACPPGIDCFMAGEEYSHGGLSLQECVVPQFVDPAWQRGGGFGEDRERSSGPGCAAGSTSTGDFEGCTVDLRDKAADPATSLAERRRPSARTARSAAGGRRTTRERDGDDARPARSRRATSSIRRR